MADDLTPAEQGNDTQRTADAARLRRLARRRPEHATALQGLIDILIPPRNQEPQISPTADAATPSPDP